jgi:hypothetical protein
MIKERLVAVCYTPLPEQHGVGWSLSEQQAPPSSVTLFAIIDLYYEGGLFTSLTCLLPVKTAIVV